MVSKKLLFVVEAVGENMEFYGQPWSSWSSEYEICSTYGVHLVADERSILRRAIESNGATLDVDLSRGE